MMTSPDRWPRWPWLPVKQTPFSSESLIGVVFAGDVGPGGPFMIRGWELGELFKPSKETLATYESPQAAVDDGWVVD
jgi:hypothetical protein